MAEELRAQLAAYRDRLGERQREFPPGVIEALRQLSGTLQGLRLSVDEMESERGRLASLADVGRVVNSSLELPTVLAEVIDTLTRMTGAERAFLMMRDEGELRVMVARNWDRSSIGPGEEAFSRTIVDRVERLGEPFSPPMPRPIPASPATKASSPTTCARCFAFRSR
jgi:hypothetical protein